MAQMSKIDVSDAATTAADTQLAGIAMGTRILTMDGEIPVEFLNEGDRIITRDAGVRVLRSLACTTHTDIAMVRISAGALGADRPGEDVLLAPGQPILLRDWRAKALYGKSQVLVAAARLIDGQYVSKTECANLRLFSLGFDAQHVIYADGLELASAAVTVTA